MHNPQRVHVACTCVKIKLIDVYVDHVACACVKSKLIDVYVDRYGEVYGSLAKAQLCE